MKECVICRKKVPSKMALYFFHKDKNFYTYVCTPCLEDLVFEAVGVNQK